MYKYELTENAKEDLFRIYRFGFEEFGETLADNYYHSLFDAFEKIAADPFAYPTVDHIRPGYRRFIHQPDSIYFRIVSDKIIITAIIGRQNYDMWL
ncbi:type II toxin-antitoxin system RelE/ParE family toxin [Thalassotalea sp. PS06]|uniref:type II toxin-antitoxin system RelE/ParE family toxin n=1 Tax=Thalassotalea sp. PS06 TaxID=2594005 RepID=UPI001162D126|nr:type II toxin-antitoxin system RelE/ParE family toxin [Thalassotalea sp. PS06]QDP01966.1 type II toxin-antitoxin system RelE/ParE family toxin [Thalassotalea sp. PS06]